MSDEHFKSELLLCFFTSFFWWSDGSVSTKQIVFLQRPVLDRKRRDSKVCCVSSFLDWYRCSLACAQSIHQHVHPSVPPLVVCWFFSWRWGDFRQTGSWSSGTVINSDLCQSFKLTTIQIGLKIVVVTSHNMCVVPSKRTERKLQIIEDILHFFLLSLSLSLVSLCSLRANNIFHIMSPISFSV